MNVMPNTPLKELVKFLSSVSFFSEVSMDSLVNLVENSIEETYVKNQTIFHKDDEGHCMYVILDGCVKIHENQHIYGQLNKTECFGEYALIDNKPRSASVTATERTKVLKIEREYFLDLMKKDSGFAHGILAVMIKRHRELDIIQERLASSKQELELASIKMKGLIEGAMDAIIMFDASFRIVLTNPSAEKILENSDVMQRNVLFFLDEKSSDLIESLVNSSLKSAHQYLGDVVTVIGSNEGKTLNEGTISKYGTNDEIFYTLILRNIEERLKAEDTIQTLTKHTEYLEEELKELTSNYGITAKDKSMQKVLTLIGQVSKTDATVLITGETGTGKELVARAIHKASHRCDKQLIRINCGAIPTNLIESELFGHKKGAFTGASSDRKGRFLLADKGTLFLDEIGELPLDLQPKLLRVIQEGEFDPVGSSDTIKVDVRIIAATHRNLLEHTEQGKFREDLYYRLNVFPIEIPPLRQRRDDISLIAQEMIQQFSNKLNRPCSDLTEYDKNLLLGYHWPGNVRELQNLIERAVIITPDGKVNWQNIIPSTQKNTVNSNEVSTDRILTSNEIASLEKENILRALRKTKWKISGKNGAAELLLLPPTTLASKIKAFGIERPI